MLRTMSTRDKLKNCLIPVTIEPNAAVKRFFTLPDVDTQAKDIQQQHS